MKERQEKLLKYIVREYIRNAKPVSSQLLERKYNLGVSSATIRNEMAELTEKGYLIQPHTSAGRVPTEKAYKFYIKKCCQPKLSKFAERKLKRAFKIEEEMEEMLREIGKVLAWISKNLSILIFEEEMVWEGLSQLASQPEFLEIEKIHKLLEVFEEICNEIELESILNGEEVKVFIGKDTPFKRERDLSLVVGGIKKRGAAMILGPMRMDYEKNIALIEKTKRLFEEIIL